jgi:uncharacterized protein (TIGR03067 family)
VTALSSAPLPFPRDRGEAALKAMQGEWIAVEYFAWTRCPATLLPVHTQYYGMRAVVAGDRLTLYQEEDVVETQVFRLRGAAGPHWIDSYPLKANGERDRDLTYRGVYEADGDRLTLCLSTVGRPMAFSADVPGERLMVLKRTKPRP